MVFNKLKKRPTSIPKYLRLMFITCLVLVIYQFIPHTALLACMDYHRNSYNSYNFHSNVSEFGNTTALPSRTLVVYVYGNTHKLSEENLAFFIRTAVRDSHNADYYFILQRIDNVYFDENTLPLLPTNAHYIQHENTCFDMGTIGWFLASGMIEKSKYKYFIFLNSSVRGPFIASYYDNAIWYTIFTRRLNDHIKLVGSTINCQTAPHVQSYIWALDFEGLNLLLKHGTIFKCHDSKKETIKNGEIGASQIILNSGFGIDSLMKKYQGMDFRLYENKGCNNRRNPMVNRGVDGISLDPFEIVFIKMKNSEVEDFDNRKRVRAYEKWIH
jgi:hypothetical protein